MSGTEALFIEDPYLRETEAVVIAVNDAGGIVLDRTCFYATSGGQPGDTGYMDRDDGSRLAVAATVNGESKADIIHLPAPGQAMPEVGERVKLAIDWERRHRLMRMHTACHLLTVICPMPITGAAVGEDESRVDFDMSEPMDKVEVTERLMALIAEDHPVFTRWISEADLDAKPDLVKSKNVRPPRGAGRVRLVCIGDDAAVDSQPCGGTHVAAIAEIGDVHIGKIEKKGKENRRFRIRFGPTPQ